MTNDQVLKAWNENVAAQWGLGCQGDLEPGVDCDRLDGFLPPPVDNTLKAGGFSLPGDE